MFYHMFWHNIFTFDIKINKVINDYRGTQLILSYDRNHIVISTVTVIFVVKPSSFKEFGKTFSMSNE